LILWGPVVAYMAVIFYASSQPDIAQALTGRVSDKILHGLEYTVLAVLITRALSGGLPRRIRGVVLIAAVLMTIAYGASDELHQSFVPGRSADWVDVLADSGGALAGVAACWAWGIISVVPGSVQGSSRDEL
jgi:VanZ family protein